MSWKDLRRRFTQLAGEGITSREEIKKLLIQARAEGYYEVFLLDLTTGLRVGELVSVIEGTNQTVAGA